MVLGADPDGGPLLGVEAGALVGVPAALEALEATAANTSSVIVASSETSPAPSSILKVNVMFPSNPSSGVIIISPVLWFSL